MRRILVGLSLFLLLTCCNRTPDTIDGLTSQYVMLDDSIKIHYKVCDHNCAKPVRTLCFVHGFGCDINTWEQQYEDFRNDKSLRLVFIDLPGYGQSDKPHVDYTLDFYARAVESVLDACQTEAVVLIGHSLGTPVCRQVIKDTRYKGPLVDIDGVYCFYDGTETPEYIASVEQFSHAFDGPDCADVITGFASSLNGKDTPKSVMDYAMSTMPQTPEYVASSTMQHLVERQWWRRIPMSYPVMVVCTKNSGLEPDNKQKMEALYPHLDYTELNTCGHFIHMEQAAWFNKKLLQFLSSL